MALKFLNKKGWHTGSLRNLEKVWKAEQKHDAEQKKLEELKVQIHKEREAEELRQLHIAAGTAPRQDRLEFLYDSGVGVGASSSKPSITTEEQNNQARISLESRKETKPAQPGETFAPAVPGALFTASNTHSANDKWRKIHSDPLYLIKQQELAARERIRKNPVKMQMLESQVRKTLEAGKDQEKEARHRDDGSHRQHEKISKSRHKDKHGKKRKHHRDGSPREKKRGREDSSSGKRRRSESPPESRHRKKHDRIGRHYQ